MATKLKPNLIVAGPGAGKTYELARRVETVLPMLAPHKYLACITFTNEASNSIREQLARRNRLGPNIFLGTFHSFANRFLIAPFAHQILELPGDRLFCGIDVWERVKAFEKRKGKKLSFQQRNFHRERLLTNLIEKGVVPYDEMIRLSLKSLSVKRARTLACGRLQHLFIDEFQDSDNRHLAIFDHIRKEGLTAIEAVGDPEQYIYGFTYGQRRLSAPPFSKIPFFRFKKTASSQQLVTNRRSCQEIVDFANRFRTDIQQRSEVGVRGEPRVFFIEGTSLEKVIPIFQGLHDLLPVDQKERHSRKRLFLGFEKATFDDVAAQFGISRFENTKRFGSWLKAALEILAMCCDCSPLQVRETLKIDQHTWRRYGVELLKSVRDGHIHNTAELCGKWSTVLKISTKPNNTTAVDKSIKDLMSSLAVRAVQRADWSSSIHQAKGLEAISVLAVASSSKELQKWCETDATLRNDDTKDECRLGFVAFSRAMELLCIACLGPLSSEARSLFQKLGVSIIDSQ